MAWQVGENDGGAWHVSGGGDDLDGMPLMSAQDGKRKTEILDGVECARLGEDGGGWNSLSYGDARHDVGLDETIVRRATGEDESGSDAALIFADGLGDAIEHGRSWVAVAVGVCAEDEDGVEARLIGVGARGEMAVDGGPEQENSDRERRERNETPVFGPGSVPSARLNAFFCGAGAGAFRGHVGLQV
uniref:Uncharacterized protein n=1 Tax=mine drainage metagenome TaxID=410659 RepID=E6QN06_9ZZZZ